MHEASARSARLLIIWNIMSKHTATSNVTKLPVLNMTFKCS